jgi:1-acyl-sn-glycerol-3-phosphate acyltransferase
VLQAIGSLLYWGFVLASAATMFPIAVVVWAITLPFDRRRVLLHRFTTIWAGLYTWVSPWSVTVEGREHIDPARTYVMVANHNSMVDIFVLFRLFAHFKWVSKIENFRLPFIGWNMSLNGYVALRRGDRESVVRMLARCEELLREGNSIMMFPEGTRSKTGELKTFKPGAFELAVRTGLPVLPIAISGTFAALPKHGFRIARQHVVVRVLPAVPPGDSIEALVASVHARIAAAVTPAAPALR